MSVVFPLTDGEASGTLRSMNESLQRLHALHLIDERIHQARQGLAALEQPHPVEQQIQKIDTERAKQESMLQKTQLSLKDAELQLKSLEQRREQDTQKLYGGKIVGTRELQALEREIEGVGQSIAAGEEKVLAVMERLESVQASVNKLRDYQKAGEAKLAAVQKEREQDRKRLQADLTAAQTLREPAAREVEPGLLSDYERIRARKGHPGLAVIEGGSCGVCHNSIPSMVMRELYEGKVLHCDTCSRIYYLPLQQAEQAS